MARKATGKTTATYKKAGSRTELMKDPSFCQAFRAAQDRISRMQIRFVEESDPIRQCLLEVYAAVVLRAPFNDFDNH